MVQFFLTDAIQVSTPLSTPLAITKDGSIVAYFYYNVITSSTQTFTEVEIFSNQHGKLVSIQQIVSNDFFQYSKPNFPGIIATAAASCDLSLIVVMEIALGTSGDYNMRLRGFRFSLSGLVEMPSYTINNVTPLSGTLSNIFNNRICVLYEDSVLQYGHITSFYIGSAGFDLQVDKVLKQPGTNLILSSNKMSIVKHFDRYYLVLVYNWSQLENELNLGTISYAYLGIADFTSQKILANSNLPLQGLSFIVFRSCDDFLKIIVATPHPIKGTTFPSIYTQSTAELQVTLVDTPNELDNLRVYVFDCYKMLLVNSYQVKGGIKGFSQNGLDYNTFLVAFSEQSPLSVSDEANGTILMPLKFHDKTNEVCLTNDLNALIGTSALAYSPIFSDNSRWLAVSGSAFNIDSNGNLINNNVQLYVIKC